jgi:signal transduction histidine kinase
MLSLSFRNRIALYYIISSALLILAVFIFIHHIVEISVYNDINTDIESEAEKHLQEVKVENSTIVLIDKEEWEEREHNTLDVNPVFVVHLNTKGAIIEKSPNLKNKILVFHNEKKDKELFDTKLDGKSIRQIQLPLYDGKQKAGYILIAMSLEDATSVLKNLNDVLIIAYPLVLFSLFFIARFIAGRSIKPINSIIDTSNFITKDNLGIRIPLPQNKDELHVLSLTINNLLDRVESAIEREKQFTSDASHELRTPLAIIKGTLEVLIRKPRDQKEYEEKILFCVSEVDRLNRLVDELLLLARFENQKQSLFIENTSLNAVILDVLTRFATKIQQKNIHVIHNFEHDFYYETDAYLVSIIISNLLSNSIKYTSENGTIVVELYECESKMTCKISDDGIGISPENLSMIFDKFYRSEPTEHPQIKGTGLGLSIVKRLCTLLQIDIQMSSIKNRGTEIILTFS